VKINDSESDQEEEEVKEPKPAVDRNARIEKASKKVSKLLQHE
jgi:hypothetical protein